MPRVRATCLSGLLGLGLMFTGGCIFELTEEAVSDLEGFIQLFGGENDEEVYSVVQTTDNGFLLAGNVEATADGLATGSGDPVADILVIKTDATGALVWKKTLGEEFRDSAIGAVEGADGISYYVAATRTTAPDTHDGLLIKLDSNGDSLWSTVVGDGDNEVFWAIARTATGEILLVGSTHAAGSDIYDLTNDADVIVVKIDTDGTILWQQEFDTDTTDIAFDVLELPSGEIAVLGVTAQTVNNALTSDTFIWQLDAAGNLLTQINIPQAGVQFPQSFIQMADGGYMIASSSTEAGTRDIHLLRIARDGTLLWTNLYAGGSDDIGEELVGTADGGAVLVGTDVTGTDLADVFILRVDRFGNTVWQQTLGTIGTNFGTCIAATPGGFAIGGFTDALGGGGLDPFLLLVNHEGILQPVATAD